MYATLAEIDRLSLPRALIARAAGHESGPTMSAPAQRRRRVYRATPWSFRVGRVVRLGMLIGIVQSRRRTAMGREIYEIRVLGENYGREFREILGAVLERDNPSYDSAHSKPHQDS
ncbi:hypothetical protein [Rhizobium sp. BE258]|uniref:hypothetical protein n=1 Tax=Rhizobium sp. BE258 TaxID=2817722 RepID=UPI002856A972|nr:hypothetical protein [Rhizobium sp. BE258]MDR7148039.1 hypothetical protein [Rhizobium sp. BE258]